VTEDRFPPHSLGGDDLNALLAERRPFWWDQHRPHCQEAHGGPLFTIASGTGNIKVECECGDAVDIDGAEVDMFVVGRPAFSISAPVVTGQVGLPSALSLTAEGGGALLMIRNPNYGEVGIRLTAREVQRLGMDATTLAADLLSVGPWPDEPPCAVNADCVLADPDLCRIQGRCLAPPEHPQPEPTHERIAGATVYCSCGNGWPCRSGVPE
jgi:hypothetical protein